MHARLIFSTLLGSALLIGCGDDSAPAVDAMPGAIDSMPRFSDGSGIVCPNAKALYTGSIFAPQATDTGSELSFSGKLDAAASTERLLLRVSSANPPTGALTLPDAAWAVSICLTEGDPCSNELVAYSGNFQVTSTQDRLQAGINEAIFVDDLVSPTCSAALSQATIDVAISGPP